MKKQAEADFAKFVHDLGWDWKKFEDKRQCPKCFHLLYRVDNRPYDGVMTVWGKTIPVEIKQDETRFPFSDLKQHQRDGLLEWEERHDSLSWIYLMLGTDRVNSNSPKRRQSWLVPTSAFLQAEQLCRVYGLKSMPLDFSTVQRVDVKEAQIYATSIFKNYRLEWQTGGWVLPKAHLLRELYNIKGAEI